MCGIAGEIAVKPDSRVDATHAPRMISVLSHRGPDDWGYYVDPAARALLVHARLAIVDLQTGRQPLCNEDGSIWVICNGELYGNRELRRRLMQEGHVFRSNSDSELIVHLYEAHGERFTEFLRGEFALVLHDERRCCSYLVRDRFGIKPLYYTQVDSQLIFGSEAKALFAHPKVHAQLDHEQLWHVFSSLMLPGASMFKNVCQVRPGTLLRIADGQVTERTYWDFEQRRLQRCEELVRLSDGEADDLFRDQLRRAVALRLQADVEVGTYLSGGIDSASVASITAACAERPVRCFTLAMPGHHDESSDAARVAARLGADLQVLHIAPADLAQNFQHSLWHSEIPTPNAHGAGKFLLSHFARPYVKVVLTGEGADELLGGYAHFRHLQALEQLSRNENAADARRTLRELFKGAGATKGLVRAHRLPAPEQVIAALGGYPYLALRLHSYRRKSVLLLSKDFYRRHAQLDSMAALGQRLRCPEGTTPLDASQYFAINTDLPNYILNNLGDRQEMAHSIEGRVPFLDHEFAEVAAALPWRHKHRDGIDKHILRRAGFAVDCAGIPKRTFLAPALPGLGLHRRRAHPVIDQHLSAARLEHVGIFDSRKITALRALRAVTPHQSYIGSVLDNALTMVLSTQILHALFVEDFAASARRYARSAPAWNLQQESARRVLLKSHMTA